MRYFTFSPLDYVDERDALKYAESYLAVNVIVQVTRYGINLVSVLPGTRPRAFPKTYLVLVQQDGSPRVVDVNME